MKDVFHGAALGNKQMQNFSGSMSRTWDVDLSPYLVNWPVLFVLFSMLGTHGEPIDVSASIRCSWNEQTLKLPLTQKGSASHFMTAEA